ncbi:ras-related protein Rab-7a-like [Drosophila sulfurigaster albostrigata]|uniref:ras-related protein Rab-7a-like n=1 Tax=Drosophila sulfurigaster albostrigata TaxID=89887 RepID=UPI002D21B7ED|nr:ras-related protein Rab-7a-like [Drosophila sulfurigaster albostrigata]
MQMAALSFFSVTNRKSFEDLNLWRNEFLSLGKPQNPEQFPIVVVGTKIEVEADRPVTKQEAQQWCDSFSIPYFECSSKAGTNVKVAFETFIAKVSDSQKRPNL